MMNFNSFSFPQKTLSSIERLIASASFPHSSMLVGGSQNEAKALALETAKALLCSVSSVSCGECSNCLKAEKNIHPDISVISPTEGRKSITMEEIRSMISDSFIIPNEAEKKVYIIMSANTLSEQVQNSLLKILEEPPQYAYFVLLCQNSSAMLGTIMSRVTAFLLGESTSVEGEAVEQAKEKAQEIAQAALEINEISLLRATADFEKNKKLTRQTMLCFKEIVNDAVKSKYGIVTDESGLASRLTMEELKKLNSIADEIVSAVDRNANEKLTMTRISAEIRRAIGG